jgi:hypothetical protein
MYIVLLALRFLCYYLFVYVCMVHRPAFSQNKLSPSTIEIGVEGEYIYECRTIKWA